MRRKILLFGILFSSIINLNSQTTYTIPENVRTILFLGNSITYAGNYITYIDVFFTTKYPDKNYTFINVGLPSETVSGLSEPNHANGEFPRPDLHDRLDRMLTKIKLDLVFTCYGMNDGIYMPFDEARFEKFKEGINWMNKTLIESGAIVIHVTPPIYDEKMGEAYANVLDIYADWLISKRYTNNWNVIDIHWPMKKFLEDGRKNDSTFVLAKDGIHPMETGHWLMSKEILMYLGEDVSQAESVSDALSQYPNQEEITKLVGKRQELMRDSWLTFIGHKRPGLNKGLSLDEADLKADEIKKDLEKLVK